MMLFETPIGLNRTTALLACLALAVTATSGCGQNESVIQETGDYSFNDVASQIAAEEAASQKERER